MAIAALFVAGDVLALALARGQAAPRSHLAGAVSRVLFIASGLCIAAAVTPWTGRFSGFRPWFLVPAALLLVSHAVVDRRWRGVGAPVAER